MTPSGKRKRVKEHHKNDYISLEDAMEYEWRRVICIATGRCLEPRFEKYTWNDP